MEDVEHLIILLIDQEKGDQMRLVDMLSRCQSGKKLFNSDYLYIDKLTEIPREKVEIVEKPINLDELRKSQPKPKYKAQTIKFGVSHSKSRRSETKIHKASCRYVKNSSQSGDIKWDFCHDFQIAKNLAVGYGDQKYACCCMRSFPSDIIFGGFILSLIFGIFGGLLAWYITKDYFPRFAKGWIVFSIISTLFYLNWYLHQYGPIL